MSSETREELLEALYQHVWNNMRTWESPDPGCTYVPYDDLEAQDAICVQIEMTDHERGV